MARPRLDSRNQLVERAMHVFWTKGYSATSMDDLVLATGVGRGSIYSDFGGKEELFLACLESYRATIVEAALETLDTDAAGLDAIEAYFDYFIGLHRKRGMPGPGCFFANVMTETAPQNAKALEVVSAHSDSLRTGFFNTLKRASAEHDAKLSDADLKELAALIAVSSQGLWSYARSIKDVTVLESFKTSFLKILEAHLTGTAKASGRSH